MFINIITRLLTIFITEYKNIIKSIAKSLYEKITDIFAFLMYKKEVYFYKKGKYKYSLKVLKNKLKDMEDLTEKEKKFLDKVMKDFKIFTNNISRNAEHSKEYYETYKKDYSKYLDFFDINI